MSKLTTKNFPRKTRKPAASTSPRVAMIHTGDGRPAAKTSITTPSSIGGSGGTIHPKPNVPAEPLKELESNEPVTLLLPGGASVTGSAAEVAKIYRILFPAKEPVPAPTVLPITSSPITTPSAAAIEKLAASYKISHPPVKCPMCEAYKASQSLYGNNTLWTCPLCGTVYNGFHYNLPYTMLTAGKPSCLTCAQPIGMVGAWTCSECGTHYPDNCTCSLSGHSITNPTNNGSA